MTAHMFSFDCLVRAYSITDLANKCLPEFMKIQTVFLKGYFRFKGFQEVFFSFIQNLIERSWSRQWRPKSDAAEHGV